MKYNMQLINKIIDDSGDDILNLTSILDVTLAAHSEQSVVLAIGISGLYAIPLPSVNIHGIVVKTDKEIAFTVNSGSPIKIDSNTVLMNGTTPYVSLSLSNVSATVATVDIILLSKASS